MDAQRQKQEKQIFLLQLFLSAILQRAALEGAAVDHVAGLAATRHSLQRIVIQLEVVDLDHIRLGLRPRHFVV